VTRHSRLHTRNEVLLLYRCRIVMHSLVSLLRKSTSTVLSKNRPFRRHVRSFGRLDPTHLPRENRLQCMKRLYKSAHSRSCKDDHVILYMLRVTGVTDLYAFAGSDSANVRSFIVVDNHRDDPSERCIWEASQWCHWDVERTTYCCAYDLHVSAGSSAKYGSL